MRIIIVFCLFVLSLPVFSKEDPASAGHSLASLWESGAQYAAKGEFKKGIYLCPELSCLK
jgi:D-alanyl-lipoteichoic acid acyltransferase DltB (MBOAT superfamily)